MAPVAEQVAGALVHDPKLIILDEPLTGLDAGAARQVKTVLRERVSAGSTVIMTTHILEVAERMADRIGVIAGGRLIAEGTLEDLRRQTGRSGTTLEETFLALVAREMLPSPPHWATRRPPGFKASARFSKRRSWSHIQWNVAV